MLFSTNKRIFTLKENEKSSVKLSCKNKAYAYVQETHFLCEKHSQCLCNSYNKTPSTLSIL